MSRGQQTLNGTNGKLYLDGKRIMLGMSCEFKITGEFQDVGSLGEQGTFQSYGGYSIEGTVTRAKLDSDFSSEIIEGFINGAPKYYDLLLEIENKYSKKKEICKLTGVVFTEYGFSVERGSMIEEELPFKAEEIEIVEKL